MWTFPMSHRKPVRGTQFSKILLSTVAFVFPNSGEENSSPKAALPCNTASRAEGNTAKPFVFIGL